MGDPKEKKGFMTMTMVDKQRIGNGCGVCNAKEKQRARQNRPQERKPEQIRGMCSGDPASSRADSFFTDLLMEQNEQK